MHFSRQFTSILTKRLAKPLNFIQIILGPRQVGKTSSALQVVDAWEGPTIYASADSPSPPDHQWIQSKWLEARTSGDNTLLVLDEVQKITGWSETIKSLYDEDRSAKKIKVVLLGSSSLLLEKGLSESLTGRFEIIKVTHWNYHESKEAFSWDLNTWLSFGGYPAAAELINEPQRWQSFMKDSIIEPVISRDILLGRTIENMSLFRQTLSLAMHYPAQELSYNKMLGQLQNKGNAATIKTYLQILEHAFLIRLLEKYSNKPIKTRTSSPKLVPLAPALIHSFTPPEKIDRDPSWRGRVFEAALLAKLLTSYGELHYWRDGMNEVDAVWQYGDRLLAIEIKSSNRKNNKGLELFKKKFPQSKTLLVDESLGTKMLGMDSLNDFLMEIS
jgi:predicted AAA+ superfamily ATPase